MCWVKHEGKLAYMISFCWTKFGFEAMKKNFPNTMIPLRFPHPKIPDDQVPLHELEYDSRCMKQREERG